MKKTNIIWLIFGIALIVLLAIWLTSEKKVQETELTHENIVKAYIEENISELSPEPEVLGGTFYVTNIDFLADNLIFIEYEDGHIDLKAEAKYSVINNEIIIDYFRLLEEREDALEQSSDQELVYDFISENISELSPESEVLGGTFFVTNIEFIGENQAIIDYEDGHIALEAQATYSIIDNQVIINSFRLIEQVDEVVEEIVEEISEIDLVTAYLQGNISELSPESEVLGGTFFVTNIEFIGENQAIVEYEDGHIDLEAEVTYSVLNSEISIESFEIIENEVIFNDEDLVTAYLQENISELSPEPEVLGGTFYVTNIDFMAENQATVEYEDGHIALEAILAYNIENNEVIIVSFDLID